MNEIVPNGEIVYVFYGCERAEDKDYTRFKRGKVVNSYQSDDLSYHGSSWYVQVYELVLEDGSRIKCTNGTVYNFISNRYFLTTDQYLNVINYNITQNLDKINELKKRNEALLEIAHCIVKEEKQDTKKRKLEK